MPERTSWLADTTTSKTLLGLPFSRFSRSLRKMFSTSTTASSTSSPMAMARPPSVMVLMERPIRWKTMAVTRIETGMAVSEIAVVRTFSRKAKSTMATTATASSNTFFTLLMEVSMKFAWRKRRLSALMPSGRVAVISANAASTCRVRRTVSTPGCFSTETMTAELPWKPASPRLTRAPKPTSAICSKATGWPFTVATARPLRSSRDRVRPMLRMRNSRLYWSVKPPPVLAPNCASAASSCSKETPSARIAAGLGETRYCRTSPPMGITCATPGIVRRRGLMVKSATSLKPIGDTPAGPVTAISMIWPMIELIGPICGTTFSGSCCWTSASRSAICCRLR